LNKLNVFVTSVQEKKWCKRKLGFPAVPAKPLIRKNSKPVSEALFTFHSSVNGLATTTGNAQKCLIAFRPFLFCCKGVSLLETVAVSSSITPEYNGRKNVSRFDNEFGEIFEQNF